MWGLESGAEVTSHLFRCKPICRRVAEGIVRDAGLFGESLREKT